MIPIRDRLPRRRAPLVNWLLILANVVAFIWERSTILLGYPTRQFLRDFGLVPIAMATAPLEHVPNVFTSMFLHDPSGWLHIGGNMLFLWIFGDNVEDALGRGRYLLFYLLSGMAAAATQVLVDPTSAMPMVGASGAIAGVLAAYGVLYPRSPITVLNPVPILWLFFGFFFQLPAWVVIAEFFLVNLFDGVSTLGTHAAGGVAFFAHVGGFIAGLALLRALLPAGRAREHERWDGFRAAPRRAPPGYYPPARRRWGS
jgi:membrane associated rhomboid family serine protease